MVCDGLTPFLLCALCLPTASLGPQNWARWGYGCVIGIALFGIYGVCEYFYNQKYGPPPVSALDEGSAEDAWCSDAPTCSPGVRSAQVQDLECGRNGPEWGDLAAADAKVRASGKSKTLSISMGADCQS